MKRHWLSALVLACVALLMTGGQILACGFEEYREITYRREMVQAMNAVFKARNQLGVEKGDERLLAVTNAGYGSVKGKSTEAFLDIVSNVTACTMGTRSLLLVHTPVTEPMWCALFRKDTGKMIFIKWTKGGFRTQRLDITPKKILSTEAWKDAASGILGKKTLFSLVTICNSWAAGAPWPLLKSAEFHNHVCPGLNVGYVIGEHLKTNHGLRNGEQYVFLGVPPICALDSFQMMFDATSGKSLTFVKAMSRQKVKQYSGTLWFEGTPLPPLIVIAMRVNKKSNSCEGVVLGMDWQRLFADAHIKYQELAPKGGKSNPLFFISRARLSIHMASMSMSQKLKYVKEIKRFFGQASLAQQLTREGVDPYAVIQTL